MPSPIPPAYEPPDEQRPTAASPTEPELEREMPTGRDAAGHDPYAALRLPSYRNYVIGNAFSMVGAQALNVTLGYELYERTNSATALGLVGLVQIIPILLLTLPAGHLVDRFNRKYIILIDHLLLMLLAASLGMASLLAARIPDLGIIQWANFALSRLAAFNGETGYHFADRHVPILFALLFLNGIIRSINQPAKQSIMPQLVPPALFPNAVTWNATIFETCTVLGPNIGGGLLALFIWLSPSSNATGGWACAAIYFLAAAGHLIQMSFFLPIVLIPMARSREPMSLRSLLAGMRFVWNTKIMLGTISLDLFAVLLGGATALIPVFAKDILHVGAWGQGALRSAPSLGAIVMAMIIAHLPPMKHAGRNLLLAGVGFGVAIIVFGLSRNFWLSLAALILTGVCDNISVVIRHTLVQLLTPDAMRGRVSAVNSVFISASNELGGTESGVTAAWWGPVAAVVVGGAGTILAVLGIAALFPQIRRLGALQDVKPQEAPEPVEAAAASA